MAALEICFMFDHINNRFFNLLFSKSPNGNGYLLSFFRQVVDKLVNVLDPTYAIQTVDEAEFLIKLLGVRQWQEIFGTKILEKIKASYFANLVFNLKNILPVCLVSSPDFAKKLLLPLLLNTENSLNDNDHDIIGYVENYLENIDKAVADMVLSVSYGQSAYLSKEKIKSNGCNPPASILRHQGAPLFAIAFYHDYHNIDIVESALSFLEISGEGKLLFSANSPKELSGVIRYHGSTYRVFVLDGLGTFPQIYRTGCTLSVGHLIVILKDRANANTVQFDERSLFHLVKDKARPLLFPFVSHYSGVIFRVVEGNSSLNDDFFINGFN